MQAFLDRIKQVWRPHDGQLAFLLSEARFRVLACGRRWGKTQACAAAIAAIVDARRRAQVLIVAPTLDQARILFDKFYELASKVIPELPAAKYSPYPKVTVGEVEVAARSGHSPDSLRGHEATHVFVDEAAFVDRRLVNDTLMPMLATTGGQATSISTPNGFNHFQKAFEWAASSPQGWSRCAPSSENPHVDPGFLAVQREMISERSFAAEYEAKFLESEGAVFRSELLDACLVDSVTLREPVWIGIDWGRVQDWTVLLVACGTMERVEILEIHRVQSRGYVAQCELLAPVIRRYPTATIRCDATGGGDACMDIVRRVMPERSLSDFTFTAESKRKMVEQLIGLVERGALKFRPDYQLMAEMRAMRWKNGRAEGDGEHDDIVMALGMACLTLPREYGVTVLQGGGRRFG